MANDADVDPLIAGLIGMSASDDEPKDGQPSTSKRTDSRPLTQQDGDKTKTGSELPYDVVEGQASRWILRS
jgi:hypothetical protein